MIAVVSGHVLPCVVYLRSLDPVKIVVHRRPLCIIATLIASYVAVFASQPYWEQLVALRMLSLNTSKLRVDMFIFKEVASPLCLFKENRYLHLASEAAEESNNILGEDINSMFPKKIILLLSKSCFYQSMKLPYHLSVI